MIKGKKKAELTMQSILERITPLQIYAYYMPTKGWKLNNVTISPFPRPIKGIEKNPSFLIGNKFGEISHIDYGMTEYRGDCFNFVQQLHSLANLDSVLRLISRDFGLDLTWDGEIKRSPISDLIVPEVTKRNTLIQVITRKFTNSELEWWNKYYQDEQDLRKEDIFSLKKVYLNKKPLILDDLRFGYFYNGFWKIYQPLKVKKGKWISNVPLNFSWGTENLEKTKNTLICKSKKDYVVCKKIYPYVCGIQNESLAAFSEEFVKEVKEKSNIIFYGGDSDEPGKRASYQITEKFGFKHINPPDHLLEECCKDMADWGKIKGLQALEEHFKLKGLIKL